MTDGGGHAELARAYAQRALFAAADAWAHAIALKLPPPSRATNHAAYRRELQAKFEAAVSEVNRGWARE
jgi:hypothetical protein